MNRLNHRGHRENHDWVSPILLTICGVLLCVLCGWLNAMDNTPHAIVEIDGYRWDSWLHKSLFQRVSVDLSTGEASEAVWEMFDPKFAVINRYTKADGIPMATVRVWLGLGAGEMGEPVFKGLLARVERGESHTAFRAYDMGFKMRLEKKTGYHNNVDDVGLIGTLAKRNGLLFEGPDEGTQPTIVLDPKHVSKKKPRHKHHVVSQDAQTDWERATECAQAEGLVLFVRGDTLFAKGAAVTAPDGQEKLTLTYRKDFNILRQFDLVYKTPENLDGRPRSVHVRVRGRGGRRIFGAAEGSDRGRRQVSLKTDLPTNIQSVATTRAHAKRDLQREHAFTVSIKTISPLPKLRPDVRDTVRLKELGLLFSGKYLTDKVRHEFAPGRLSTSYDLYRDTVN